jgi:hypothetical protein
MFIATIEDKDLKLNLENETKNLEEGQNSETKVIESEAVEKAAD